MSDGRSCFYLFSSIFLLEVSVFKKQIAPFWFALIVLLVSSLACNFSGTPTATAVPTPIPTQAVAAGDATAVLPTAIPLPTHTAVPAPATATETATAVSQAEATATLRLPADSPTTAVSPTPAMVGTAVRLFGPGQQDAFSLEPGAFKTYTIQGVKFQPLFVFAEIDGDADLTLKVAAGTDTAVANPAAAAPLAEADFSPAGRPEVLVFSADEDGFYTLIVGNKGSGAGETAVYLFDEATDTPLATHYRGETLAAGQTKSFIVQSNGGRPVVAFAEPLDQSDLVLKFIEAGSIANEANFSGPGSAEAAFVLPLRTTDYTIEISTASGGAATFTLIVVPLE